MNAGIFPYFLILESRVGHLGQGPKSYLCFPFSNSLHPSAIIQVMGRSMFSFSFLPPLMITDIWNKFWYSRHPLFK